MFIKFLAMPQNGVKRATLEALIMVSGLSHRVGHVDNISLGTL